MKRTPGLFLLFLLLAALALPRGASAQAGRAGAGPGVVTGEVQSEAGQPLARATVAVRRAADSTVVGGKITAQDGRFRVDGLAPGDYLVEVSLIGYTPQTKRGVAVTAAAPTVDLGKIELATAVVMLQGIQARAERPAMQILPDRTAYSTKDMPVASGGTATDALRTVPELEVDVNGKVTSRGATPKIYINGRPAPMQGEALDNYLQQLPANRIDRIEVIPNPSARYEAEGQGGIVNIVMKEGVDLGLSGSLSANSGTQGQNGGSARLNYQEGRVTFFGGASMSLNHQDYSSDDERENLITDPITYLRQAAETSNHGSFGALDLTTELKTSKRGTLWVQLQGDRYGSGSSGLTAYTLMNDVRAPTERYDRLNDSDNGYLDGTGSIGFRRVVQPQRQEWSLELRKNWSSQDNESESSKLLRAITGEELGLPPELTRNDGGEDDGLLTLQADMSQPWGKNGGVELGYRGSIRDTDNDRTLDVFPTAESTDPTRSTPSAFDYRETVNAGYLTLTGKLGPFGLQGGVRAERSDTRFSLPLTGDSYENDYASIFPNANVSVALGGGKQLRLSYSKRMDRPWAWILNPINPSTDPLNRTVGNPFLKPRYTHSLMMDASWSGQHGTLRLSPYYRNTVDTWDQIKTVDEEGVSTVTWFNLSSIASYGSSLSASLRPTGPFSGFASLSAYREVRDASNLATDFSGSAVHWSANTNLTVRASSSLNVQGAVSYYPSREVPQGRISSMLYSSVGARKQIAGTKASINLSIVDPFDLYHVTFTTHDQTHQQTSKSRYSLRRAMLSITYNFGRPPQSNRKSSQPDAQPQPDSGGGIH
jgi:hypothetical protein